MEDRPAVFNPQAFLLWSLVGGFGGVVLYLPYYVVRFALHERRARLGGRALQAPPRLGA